MLFPVPFGQLGVILSLDWLLVDHILTAVLEKLLVACDRQNLELSGIPLLCVDLLDEVLAGLELVVVDGCAGFADEDGVSQLEMRRLVAQTVDAVGVVGDVSHALLEIGLHFA